MIDGKYIRYVLADAGVGMKNIEIPSYSVWFPHNDVTIPATDWEELVQDIERVNQQIDKGSIFEFGETWTGRLGYGPSKEIFKYNKKYFCIPIEENPRPKTKEEKALEFVKQVSKLYRKQELAGLVEEAKEILGEESECAHKNTKIWEPHLAGARKCLDCNKVYNPNRTPKWQLNEKHERFSKRDSQA